MLRQAIAIAGALCLAPSPSLAYQVPADYVLLGAGIRSRPAYDGAAASRAEAIPVIRYYGRPWFARTTQGMLEAGVRTRPDRGLTYGAQLAYEGGRAQAESAFLESHRVDDIDPGASFGGAALVLRPGPRMDVGRGPRSAAAARLGAAQPPGRGGDGDLLQPGPGIPILRGRSRRHSRSGFRGARSSRMSSMRARTAGLMLG